jgi:hypothetical protein
MRARFGKLVAAVAAVAAALTIAGTGTSSADGTGLRAYGLLNNGKQLCMFTTDNPGTLDWVKNVTGLTGDTLLIGLDFRVQDGKLYGVGNQGGIYTIGIPDVTMRKVSQLSVPLQGTKFGVDFNPPANRLRVVSDVGQNLRHNIDDGVGAGSTTVDGPLNTPPSTATTTGVTAVAYTNNDLSAATGTTLFDLDTTADQISLQAPPNNGTLNPTGTLGLNASLDAGMDIFSDLTNGRTTSVSAFATIAPEHGAASLYSIQPLTGWATFIGEFPLSVSEIAIALDTN